MNNTDTQTALTALAADIAEIATESAWSDEIDYAAIGRATLNKGAQEWAMTKRYRVAWNKFTFEEVNQAVQSRINQGA